MESEIKSRSFFLDSSKVSVDRKSYGMVRCLEVQNGSVVSINRGIADHVIRQAINKQFHAVATNCGVGSCKHLHSGSSDHHQSIG